jgi:ribose transport system substrate-binding protein
MFQMKSIRAGLVLLAALGAAVALAACGGGGSSSSSEASTTEAPTTAEKSETGGEAGGGDVAKEAAAVVAPFTGHPSPFPVTEPLKKVPNGAKMTFVDSGTPFAALQWEFLQPAAKTMGVDMERVSAGVTPNTVGPALDSVVAKQPEAVLVDGVPIELWTKQLKELQDAGVTITASGVYGIEKYGVEPVQGQEPYGELMANYVVGKMNPEANVVVYTVPEVPPIKKTAEEFEATFPKLCPECEMRSVIIHASEIGNTAPNTIVSDLQAHPDTDVAVFGADEIQNGLPAARQAAGIEVETLGLAPTPTNLQYLKEGKETAALGYDAALGMWEQLDQAARELTGQELTGPQSEGLGVLQFLTQKDITFDPKKGWSGYPNFPEEFAKLWGVG